ncbi:MAG: 1-(5-phosphoribosyl)-5-[(5-phosphoribosylamino)methylideneamino] imidazole-4-carboxamide isomerase [Gemmatimonadetes bacterium]|nr:1-(5-phosphoribosyl)-5-[(5-phosphoribosylamino)methylideneamino] imidazole-4-carboxamide isomerase [Gemmatimonadota bacterium]
MNVFAALDLRGGAVVQLVGGDPAAERVRLPDAAAVARRWRDAGFRSLHVVDLDAALGTGANEEAVEAIARERLGLLQVGGGIRDRDAITRVLALGVDRAIVGTRAVEDGVWLEDVATACPGRLVVAADVRDGVVVTRGWTESAALPATAFIAGIGGLPLAAVLVTDVTREGREEGIDGALFDRVIAASPYPVIAAGGIAGRDDLMMLRDMGAAGAVLGMALYTGRIDPAEALEMENE